MRFVRCKTLAGELRGEHIARQLGVECSTELGEPRALEWVVFVKETAGIEAAKSAGCMVAFDPVDLYCYSDRDRSPWPEIDLVIIPNRKCMKHYKDQFPNADFLLVPHQWDARIEGKAPQDQFRPGYVGRKFNLREELNIQKITDEDEQLSSLALFNCHVADCATAEAVAFKPATKVAGAAAVGSNIVTHKAYSAVELLGAEYPFYATGTLFDALYKAKKAFGTSAWDDGLAIMSAVRERTSVEAVANLYKVLN